MHKWNRKLLRRLPDRREDGATPVRTSPQLLVNVGDLMCLPFLRISDFHKSKDTALLGIRSRETRPLVPYSNILPRRHLH